MSYSFLSHLDSILEGLPASSDSWQAFALIDAGQFVDGRPPVRTLVGASPSALLFEDSFAKSALHLSPVLVELPASADSRRRQIETLDAACRHLPVMSLIVASTSLDSLLGHLRSLLLIEAADTPYLLRFADTQTLRATASVLDAPQRSCFFSGLRHWWTVDHTGAVSDVVPPTAPAQPVPPASPPLRLDADQTDALLRAVAAPVLARQLHSLDETFGRTLTHADQTAFAADCIEAGRSLAVNFDSDLTSLALQRWRERVPTRRSAA